MHLISYIKFIERKVDERERKRERERERERDQDKSLMIILRRVQTNVIET